MNGMDALALMYLELSVAMLRITSAYLKVYALPPDTITS